MDISRDGIDMILSALGEQLGALGARIEIVVIGGSALLALGLVTRPTKDVDVPIPPNSFGSGSRKVSGRGYQLEGTEKPSRFISLAGWTRSISSSTR